MSDDQYWNITSYYLVFAAINLGLTYLLYRAWKDHLRTWLLREKTWQLLLLLFAALLLVLATAVLVFMHYATYEGWKSAINPDTPAPMFQSHLFE